MTLTNKKNDSKYFCNICKRTGSPELKVCGVKSTIFGDYFPEFIVNLCETCVVKKVCKIMEGVYDKENGTELKEMVLERLDGATVEDVQQISGYALLKKFIKYKRGPDDSQLSQHGKRLCSFDISDSQVSSNLAPYRGKLFGGGKTAIPAVNSQSSQSQNTQSPGLRRQDRTNYDESQNAAPRQLPRMRRGEDEDGFRQSGA